MFDDYLMSEVIVINAASLTKLVIGNRIMIGSQESIVFPRLKVLRCSDVYFVSVASMPVLRKLFLDCFGTILSGKGSRGCISDPPALFKDHDLPRVAGNRCGHESDCQQHH